MTWSRKTLSVLLALLLVLSGLNLQKHIEQPVFGATQPATGIAAFLSAVDLAHTNVCLTEETGNLVIPVQRQRNTSKTGLLQFAVSAAALQSLCQQPGGLVQRLRCLAAFPTPCWRAITSHIHRTRKKRSRHDFAAACVDAQAGLAAHCKSAAPLWTAQFF